MVRSFEEIREEIESSAERVSLWDDKIGDDVVKALADLLKTNTSVKYLSLSGILPA